MIRPEDVVFFLVVISFLFQVFYGFYFFKKFIYYDSSIKSNINPPVSVVISAKNEAGNLKKKLPLWLDQDYPQYEIVIINDRSTDETENLLSNWENDKRLKIVHVEFQEWKSFIGNKKFALTLGIKAASFNHLVFTDADCRPASKNWIKLMASGFTEGKEIVLGYGKYRKLPGYLNYLIRYETVLTAMQYFGYALRGIPYMGVGRNLAYTKELFFKSDGFKNHFEVLSGDDDLFVNENAHEDNTSICFLPESHTISVPEKSWKSYINQKRRHYSTAKYYRFKHKILLFLFSLTRFIFWGGSVFLLFSASYRYLVLLMIFVKMISDIFYIRKAGNKLKDEIPLLLIPVLEIHLILLQLFIFVSGIFKKKISWK